MAETEDKYDKRPASDTSKKPNGGGDYEGYVHEVKLLEPGEGKWDWSQKLESLEINNLEKVNVNFWNLQTIHDPDQGVSFQDIRFQSRQRSFKIQIKHVKILDDEVDDDMPLKFQVFAINLLNPLEKINLYINSKTINKEIFQCEL